MRLQLTLALAVTGVAGLGAAGTARTARADGTLAVRGVYYKERATRVMQPMLDAMFDVGTHGVATGHFLVDAITSASASSGADDAAFTENRVEGGIGYAHNIDTITVAGNAKYSKESDYTSLYLGARVQAELFQKNTVLGLGGGISRDTISAAGAQGPSMPTLRCDEMRTSEPSCELDVYAVYASASQVVSPRAVIGVSVDVSSLRGYQTNPYRLAIVGEILTPERHPTERTRQAFAVSGRYYLPDTRMTVIGAYRYYRDTWKVHAHTPELRIVQEIGYSVDAALGYRYYKQDGAYFFRDRYPPDNAAMTQFVSDDVKLSDFTGHTMEAKLGVLGEAFGLGGRWAEARLEGILEYAIQHNRFGNAVIAHAALTIPFSY
jgi:Protein of unknown function (DUF3570)